MQIATMFRLSILFISASFILNAQETGDSLVSESEIQIINEDWIYPDDPYVSGLDSSFLDYVSLKGGVSEAFDSSTYSLPLDSIPPLDEDQIKFRLSVLDSLTPLSLEYNKYSARMINFYLSKRRQMLARVLGMSTLYFPLFEQELAKEQMPLELKYLAVVESALLNRIKSRAGAVGLWQFMYNTGVYLGMEIDSYIDERRDPVVSTKYAVIYLKYLHGLYDDWYMALAAYNAGPGNVNKAIRRSGGKRTFWEIYNYLPRETRSYVPAFIAVNYAMEYAKENNIRPINPNYHYHEIDTVQINKATSFDQISEVLCISVDELKFLNPQYKLEFIPVNKKLSKSYWLVLPYSLIGEFVINEKVIYSYNLSINIDSTRVKSSEEEIVHIVRSGQNIGRIANKHNVTVRDIKKWNNLRSNVIQPKQKLIIKINSSEKRGGKKSKEITYYVVKKGDTLSEIAERHTGVSVRSLTLLNNLSRRVVLRTGTKLILKKTGGK